MVAQAQDTGNIPSTSPSRGYDQTIAYARTALEQIGALKLPADPQSFAVWYTYATGRHPGLNQAINEIMKRDGTLSIADLDRIHEAFVAPTVGAEQIEAVSGMISDEVDQVVAMVDAAIGSSANYSENLFDASQRLPDASNHESLRGIIESLIGPTKEVEQQNQRLKSSLNSSKCAINELQEKLVTIRSESLTDQLTSVGNRKHFDEALELAIKESGRQRHPLSLLMCDVDHFKKFNDRFGHVAGDDVLRLIASIVKASIRGQDTLARYGGEEFAVILPDTALQPAISVGENVRKAIFEKTLVKRSTGETFGRITLSVGVAQFQPGETSQTLIERADSHLYAAKKFGRNRVMPQLIRSE